MTKTLTYTRPNVLAALHDQLLAAGYQPWPVMGGTAAEPDLIRLGFPDAFADDAGVASVVAAHDKAAALAAYDAARQAEADDDSQVRTAVATLLADADNLVALATALENSANAFTTQQLRDRMGQIARGLARTDRILAGALRVIARRLGG